MAPTIGRVALDNGFHGSIPGDWVAPPPQNIHEGYITNMKCLPENLEDKKYYIPKQSGGEKVVAERLARIEKLREYIEKSN